ncbi:hypothetical protein ACFOKI_15330 [Sphingomonas qilianensis]|uniref:Uncharacterized protein n=2 Tax=Sphingomonas qilianensis TaxID=1736690 RepID=A0ABU9XM49_9SPHN
MRGKTITTGLALWLSLAASTAQAAAPCITQPEAESLVITLLPDLIEAAGQSCAASLPPEATLRMGLAPTIARYRAAAPAVLPQVTSAIAKLVGSNMAGIDPALLRPLISTVVAPLLATEIEAADCPQIDRAVTLLAPLPARSVAGIAVLLFTLGTDGRKKQPPFKICPLSPAQPRP